MIRPDGTCLIGNQLTCDTSVLGTQCLRVLQLCFQEHAHNGKDKDQHHCGHEDQNGASHKLLLIRISN